MKRITNFIWAKCKHCGGGPQTVEYKKNSRTFKCASCKTVHKL